MRRKWLLYLSALALVVAALTTAGFALAGDGASNPGPGGDTQGPSDGVIRSDDGIDPDRCNMVHNIFACERQAADAAKAGLSQRLGVEAGSITVASLEFVEWPNACLGVSNPDMMCAEVITYGYKVVLEAQGKSYEYHTDLNGHAVLAE